MAELMKRGRDSLTNGVVLGAVIGAMIVWGDKVLGFIEGIVPSNWIVLGVWSVPLYVIGAGALIGYIIDRY